MATQLILQQNPNYFNSISKGLEAGQNMRANDVKIQAAEQEMAQKQELSALMKLAPYDANAMKMLAMRAPEAAKGLRDAQSYTEAQGSKIIDGFFAVPVFEHSQESYDKLHADYKAATKEELPAPINYSEQALKGLKAFQTRLKGREQELKEQKAFQDIKMVEENIKTEPYQRANLAASAAKSRSDIQKNVYEVAKQIREEARTQGGYDPELARKVDADLIKTTSEAATSARSGQTVLNQLETILKDKDTSKFKSLYTAAGAFTGIGSKKNIADYQSSRSLTVKLATESLKMMGGNDSNTDVALQMNAAPGYDIHVAGAFMRVTPSGVITVTSPLDIMLVWSKL